MLRTGTSSKRGQSIGLWLGHIGSKEYCHSKQGDWRFGLSDWEYGKNNKYQLAGFIEKLIGNVE